MYVCEAEDLSSSRRLILPADAQLLGRFTAGLAQVVYCKGYFAFNYISPQPLPTCQVFLPPQFSPIDQAAGEVHLYVVPATNVCILSFGAVYGKAKRPHVILLFPIGVHFLHHARARANFPLQLLSYKHYLLYSRLRHKAL